ncbi:Modification methylase [Seminavis robusta]|uniref:DNA (cytosine-5-)-methyltransferase n=1 Tax=Seminavis robusta TaxID=568900 RepID=A0A9N8HNV7_9STRA|nr:Modification methylase [Seminavis robusta]|eukprot:Sro1261_g256990.1 Modification methylase (1255) ;mRNA; f:2906-6670
MPRNTLNLVLGHCSHWTLNEAIREVVQNAVDGAVEWMHSGAGGCDGKGKSDLRPAGRGWYITSSKPPKKFSDAGFIHGGKAEMILTVFGEKEKSAGTKWVKPKTMRQWHKDQQQSLAYIRLEVASKQVIDWTAFKEEGRQPPGTVLVRCETINRLVPSFRMVYLVRIGKTFKKSVSDQAGQFGEGFKVGALVAVRNDFTLVVEAGQSTRKVAGQSTRKGPPKTCRREFLINKGVLCYSKQESRLSKEAKENPNLIFVKLHLKQPPQNDVPNNYHHFNPSFFRLLSPGVPHCSEGAVMKRPLDKGSIYCMGIFVAKRKNLLLGYDVPDKKFITGRDRNASSIHTEALQDCIRPMIERACEEDGDFMADLVSKVLEIEDESTLRLVDEVNALLQSEELCEKFANCFRKEKDADAFPCRRSEEKSFNRTFRNRPAIILQNSVVDILRKGGYRDIEAEISFLFSEKNRIGIGSDDEKLIESSLFRLKNANDEFQIQRESIVCIDGRFINSQGEGLSCRSKGEKFYVNNSMLSLSDEDDHPFLRASNKLGFTIALQVGEIKDFAFKYSEISNSDRPWFTFDLEDHGGQRRICVCNNMLEETHKVRATTAGEDEPIVFHLTGLYTPLPALLRPGVEYSIEPVDSDSNLVMDPLTRKYCTLSLTIPKPEARSSDASDQGVNDDLTVLRGNNGVGEDGSVDRVVAGNDLSTFPSDLSGGNADDSSDTGSSSSAEEGEDSDIEDDVTIDEIMSVFGNEDDSDYSDSESESDDQDDNREPKRARRIKPCDETSAIFGSTEISVGGVYNRGADIVRVEQFVGNRLPVRRARCQIVCTVSVALRNSFNRIQLDSLNQRLAAETVYEEAEKGVKFMKTLYEYDGEEDFEELRSQATFQLTRSTDQKKSNFLVEFKRLKLDPTEPFVPRGRGGNPRELVLFAGVGGSSTGDKNAGMDVSWLVEKDPLAAASLRESHPQAMIFQEDVRSFLGKCKAKTPGYPKEEDVEHLQGSPPCTGYSSANRGGRNDHTNNLLSYEIVRAVEILSPRTGVMENVAGILRPKHLKHSTKILIELLHLGYQVRIAIHNATYFGDPQNRNRVIFTFVRQDTPLPSLPEPISTPKVLGDALQGLPEDCDMMEGSGLHRFDSGGLAFNHVASKPTLENTILDMDEPVNTITTKSSSGLVHPTQLHRTLSIRELARLFSYPDSKQFFGSLTAMRKQIGNSVPVKLAEAVTRPIVAMYHELSQERRVDSNTTSEDDMSLPGADE